MSSATAMRLARNSLIHLGTGQMLALMARDELLAAVKVTRDAVTFRAEEEVGGAGISSSTSPPDAGLSSEFSPSST
jgi:hypothetical protein